MRKPRDTEAEPSSGQDSTVEPAHKKSQAPTGRKSRRARLPAPAGSDPRPFDPPLEPRSENENDDRLSADKPPHWA